MIPVRIYMIQSFGSNMEQYLNQIICGDCLDVMREMPDKCVDLVLTDPPYGEEYCKIARDRLGQTNFNETMMNSNKKGLLF